jgi:methionyl aminopeptidase
MQAPLATPDMLLRISAPMLRSTRAFAPTSTRPVSTGRPSRLDVVAKARRGLSELLSINGKVPESVGKRAPLKPGLLSPPRPVPAHIPRPPYADTGALPDWDSTPQFHDAAGLEKMRAACKLAAQVLDHAGSLVAPGITTDAIDAAVHKMAIDAGAYPSPLNYGKFPKSVCTSVNECICHGIPDNRPLQAGDIVNIDVTVYLDGYHGDTSRMFYVGEVSEGAKRLCVATTEALMAGIGACGPGAPLKGIGHAIQAVAEKHKFNLSKSFIGHGVGTVFHSSPHVFHTRNNEPGVMTPGMTFTIEPMLCEGSAREKFWKDGWTAVTSDGGLSAQQEHTLLITDNGVEILTVS